MIFTGPTPAGPRGVAPVAGSAVRIAIREVQKSAVRIFPILLRRASSSSLPCPILHQSAKVPSHDSHGVSAKFPRGPDGCKESTCPNALQRRVGFNIFGGNFSRCRGNLRLLGFVSPWLS